MKRELWKCDRCGEEWDRSADSAITYEQRGRKDARQLIRVEIRIAYEPSYATHDSQIVAHVCRPCAEKLGLAPAIDASNTPEAEASQAMSPIDRITGLARELFGLLVEESPSA